MYYMCVHGVVNVHVLYGYTLCGECTCIICVYIVWWMYMYYMCIHCVVNVHVLYVLDIVWWMYMYFMCIHCVVNVHVLYVYILCG